MKVGGGGGHVHVSALLPTKISQYPLGRRQGVPRDGLDAVDTGLLGTQGMYGSHKRFGRWIRTWLCLIAGLDAVDAAEIVPEWAWPQRTG
jgi:hypothetical protein